MLLMECRCLEKYYGDRLILKMDQLKIHAEDRIGIVGINGSGKTTLLNILSQRAEPDKGQVRSHGSCAYITQLESVEHTAISSEMASKFNVSDTWQEHMSGGEKTRFKLAQAIEENKPLIFADEPTSNVDMEGIVLMEEYFAAYKGALILVSHDRDFLDRLCNKIWELDNGRIKVYNGNYSGYRTQKDEETARVQAEYEQYVKEKRRLENAVHQTKQESRTMNKTPRRMGNSEARLHKMGNQRAKANLDKAVKHIETRIEHLAVKEKPKKQQQIRLDTGNTQSLNGRILIEGQDITKAFDDKVLFKEAAFTVNNGKRAALIGPNGCGKSTLIKMILERDAAIKIAQGVKVGYFSQDQSILEENASIIENVMKESIHPEVFARTLLARLLFKGDDIYKRIRLLSGGERVKVSFAKILLQDVNLLILDEPTNYMDIDSLEVVEEALRDYDRTLLFVSHDRRFVNAVANTILAIEDKKIKVFQGNYHEYLAGYGKNVDEAHQKREYEICRLQNRLTEVLGRLSMPSRKDDPAALDREYYEILNTLNQLKK